MSALRTALCISGMPRTFKETYESVQTNILAPHRPEVFVSTWKPTQVDPLWTDPHSPEELVELYKPIKFDIELFDEARRKSFETNQFRTRADWGGDAVHRMIPMFYRIYICNLHKWFYEKENRFTYDVVIRSRSDLLFSTPLVIPPLEDGLVYMAPPSSDAPVNDQFWLSNSKTADLISALYLSIPTLWHGGVKIHGETLLTNYLASLGLRAQYLDIQFTIARPPEGPAWAALRK